MYRIREGLLLWNESCAGKEQTYRNVLARLTVNFDRFRAPRSVDASASIELASKKRRPISLDISTARQQNIVRAPKTTMRRFLLGKLLGNAMIFSTVFDAFDGGRSTACKWGWLAGLGWLG